ncbi:lactoylglutathione lyase [Fonsecaea pedrosoi]|nr:lactoylglutathione lyase [Fonsecaea pedrosoi]
MPTKPTLNVNHLALSVPDIGAAVDWYTSVFGFTMIGNVMEVNKNSPTGPIISSSRGLLLCFEPYFDSRQNLHVEKKVYGEEFEQVKLAILTSANGVGLEIFEFVRPKYNGPERRVDWCPDTYTKGGVFHFCFTVANVEETARRAIESGGKNVGVLVEPAEGEQAFFVQDPWGNVIELLSCSFDVLFLKRLGG